MRDLAMEDVKEWNLVTTDSFNPTGPSGLG